MAKSKNTRKSKISKKAKLRILLFFIIFGGIIGSLSYSFFSNVNKIVSIKKEKQVLNDRIAELTDEEKVLNSDIKKLEDSLKDNYAANDKMHSEIKNIELVIDALDNFNENIDIIHDINQRRLLVQAITDTILWDGETYTAKVKIHGINDDEFEDDDDKKKD